MTPALLANYPIIIFSTLHLHAQYKPCTLVQVKRSSQKFFKLSSHELEHLAHIEFQKYIDHNKGKQGGKEHSPAPGSGIGYNCF